MKTHKIDTNEMKRYIKAAAAKSVARDWRLGNSRRTHRHQSGFFVSKDHGKPVMGALCGHPSGWPVPTAGTPIHIVASSLLAMGGCGKPRTVGVLP